MMSAIYGLGKGGGKLTLRNTASGKATAVRIGPEYQGGFSGIGKTHQVNLGPARDFSPAQAFLDISRTARLYAVNSGATDYDYGRDQFSSDGRLSATGHPVTTPNSGVGSGFSINWAWEDAHAQIFGRYRVEWTGDATLDVDAVTLVSSGANTAVIETAAAGNWGLKFTNITTPITAITVVHEDHMSAFDGGAKFHPLFLADLTGDQQVSCVRFMDWMETNDNHIESWSEYPTEDYMTWWTVPISVTVDLCNEIGADGWWCIPGASAYAAQDGAVDTSFATELATYLKANLNTDLKAKVEYANEVWNSAFQIHNKMNEQAVAAGWSNTNRQGYCAKINVLMAQAMLSVYGDDASSRFRWVLGSGLEQTFWTEEMVTASIWQEEEPEEWIDPQSVSEWVSVAHYCASKYIANTTLRDALVARIDAGDTQTELNAFIQSQVESEDYVGDCIADMQATRAVCDTYGFKLDAYEGWWHLLHSFNLGLSDAELAPIVPVLGQFTVNSTENVGNCAALWNAMVYILDGPFQIFSVHGRITKFGAFLMRTEVGETNLLQTYIEDRSRSENPWWKDDRRPVPDPA